MGRNCIGRFGYGPKLTLAEIVMGRNVHWPLIAIPHSIYLTPASKKTRAAHSKFQQYPTSTDCFKFSFFPRTIPVWNRLLAAAAEAPSFLYHSRGSWGALPSKWGFPPGHEVNLNDECWTVPSGLVPRYPQVGLPRLRNLVNVYTSSSNLNDSVNT